MMLRPKSCALAESAASSRSAERSVLVLKK
jgi:hypothetical protein